jgi:serine/threonine protein kinase
MDTQHKEPTLEELIEHHGVSELDLAKIAAKHLDQIKLADALLKALGREGLLELYKNHPELRDNLIIIQGITRTLHTEDYFQDFRIVRRLKGGMGGVFIATYDPEHARERGVDSQIVTILDRRFGNKPVAVKVMLDVRGEAGRDRFDREMDASKNLDSELLANVDPRLGEIKGGVIPILDDGYDEEGNPYFVMPVLFRMEKGKIPEKDALTLGLNVARIISAVHDRGMIHRDLKPANVLLTQRGAYEKPVVCDFGLVKHVLSADSWMDISRKISTRIGELQSDNVFAEEESFYDSITSGSGISILDQTDGLKTTLETILGTPLYMSPEQARGDLNDTLAMIDKYKKQKERLLIPKEERDKVERMISEEEDSDKKSKLRADYIARLKRLEERLAKYGGKGDHIKEFNRKINECHQEACKSDQYAFAAMIYTWVTGRRPFCSKSDKRIKEVRGPRPVRELICSIQDPDTELLFLPNELGVSDNLSAVLLKAMEKDAGKRYGKTASLVSELEMCLKGKPPWVLRNNPGYLSERMLRKAGVGHLLEERKYREGRENLQELIEQFKNELERNPKEVVGKLVESWSAALGIYRKKLWEKLSECRERLCACTVEEFAGSVKELLELIYETKILPVEERIGGKFPSSTDENGKWKLKDGRNRADCYWTDTLRMYGLGTHKRISFLKTREDTSGIDSALRAYLIYQEDGDKELFLQKMEQVEEIYRQNNGLFIPLYDKNDLDARGHGLGGTLLGVESLTVVDALFAADSCTSDSRYTHIAAKQIDAVINNLMRKDGSVFRFAIFDQHGNLVKKAVDTLAHHIIGKENPDAGYDKFENGKNVSKYTPAKMQAYFIAGLVAAYRHTKNERYKTAAGRAIKFFMSNLPADLVSYYATGDPKGTDAVRNSAPTAIAASSLIDYSDLTGNAKARKTAVKLLQALIRDKLDVSQGCEGLITGYRANSSAKEKSHVESDSAFLKALSKLAALTG